jgi:hypothetical protein
VSDNRERLAADSQAGDLLLAARLMDECAAWKALAESRGKLLSCYRLGTKPSEAMWRKLEDAVFALRNMGYVP